MSPHGYWHPNMNQPPPRQVVPMNIPVNSPMNVSNQPVNQKPVNVSTSEELFWDPNPQPHSIPQPVQQPPQQSQPIPVQQHQQQAPQQPQPVQSQQPEQKQVEILFNFF